MISTACKSNTVFISKKVNLKKGKRVYSDRANDIQKRKHLNRLSAKNGQLT